MERDATPTEAWEDFFAWVRTQPLWGGLSESARNYVSKANTAYKGGHLGPVRIRTILERYGNGRYQFSTTVIIKE